MDKAIQQTNERYSFLAQDKDTLHRYHLHQIGLMDWNNVTAERDQEHAGRLKAEQRAEQEHAARMQEHAARIQERAAHMQERTARMAAERRIAEMEAQIRK